MNILSMNPHETMFIPLVGSPISHSTATSLYNCICDIYDINAMFYPKEIKEGELQDFFKACKTLKFRGAMLTMPHKGTAVDFMDEVDEVSKAFRSVNCVRFEDGKAIGRGFDGKGVIYAFDQVGVDFKGKEVVMIGSGGVGGIFAAEMAGRGVKKLTILNRTVSKAERIAAELGRLYPEVQVEVAEFTVPNAKKACETAEIFLQATCLGMVMKEDYEDISFIDALPNDCWVMDAVSNPPETKLVQYAKSKGYKTVIGMDMLVCQVEAIFDFMFGVKLDSRGREAARDFYCKLFNFKK